MVNYTTETKDKVKHNANYTEDIRRDQSKEETTCWGCIFVGENENVSKSRLCAKYIDEVAEVKGSGTCDDGKSWYRWYNKIYVHFMPIKTLLLERTGFKFKNR